MKFLKCFYLAVFSILASGCVPSKTYIGKEVEKTPLSDRAYIIGKYTVQCDNATEGCSQGFNLISLSYQDMPEKQHEGWLSSSVGSIFGDNTNYDFMNEASSEKGIYFCEALPPGDYSFYNFRYYDYAGGGSGYSLNEKGQFELPFSLEKGEIAYIGQLKMTTTSGKNFLGIKVYGPGFLEISSDPESDVELALKKCPPHVQMTKVALKPVKAELANSPFVKHKSAK